jgi:hypothetical protein
MFPHLGLIAIVLRELSPTPPVPSLSPPSSPSTRSPLVLPPARSVFVVFFFVFAVGLPSPVSSCFGKSHFAPASSENGFTVEGAAEREGEDPTVTCSRRNKIGPSQPQPPRRHTAHGSGQRQGSKCMHALFHTLPSHHSRTSRTHERDDNQQPATRRAHYTETWEAREAKLVTHGRQMR